MDNHVTKNHSRTIVFNIINGAAIQLDGLHALSDAGAGQDLMHLTPTRDSELIANGVALTPFPILPASTELTRQGLLDNGGISPAVLTRGLLKYLSDLGYNIEFCSYNLGVPLPKAGHSNWISRCKHFGGEDAQTNDVVEQHLLPELLNQAKSGHISVLAECGVGGTTFSTLWLRLLTKQQISPAGSTKDKVKLAKKALLLNQLEREYRAVQAKLKPDQDGDSQPEFCAQTLLANSRFHDQVQQALYQLLNLWPSHLKLPQLAGGMMFVAPVLAVLRLRTDLTGAIDTTRWVLDGEGQAESVLTHLPAQWQLNLNRVNLSHSKFNCLQIFEQGIVVEGCGFGGLMVLAESLNVSSQQIVQALESACETHFRQFSSQTCSDKNRQVQSITPSISLESQV